MKRVVYIDLGNGLEQWDGKEYWKDIPNYEGLYEVSTYGNIRNAITKAPRKLKEDLSRGGYYTVSLSKSSKYSKYFVHRLVAITFLPNPKKLPVVNHIDFCRTNCRVDNLEWCTYQYNAIHAKDRTWSEDNKALRIIKRSKPVEQYNLDGKLLATFSSLREAENKTGICNIARVVEGRGKTAGGFIWKFKGNIKANRTKGKKVELYNPKTNRIIRTFSSMVEAAKELGISYNTVQKHVDGRFNKMHNGMKLRKATSP